MFTYVVSLQIDLHKLLNEFSRILTGTPEKVVNNIEHRIQLKDNQPSCCKPYPMPHNLRDTLKSEVQEMCRLGIIERSKSPYSSPMLLVKKKAVQTALLLISENKTS